MLLALVLVFIFGVCLTGLTIRLSNRHGIGVDGESGVQKQHINPVPRLGGLAIFVCWASGLALEAIAGSADVDITCRLIVVSLPAFGIGLLEDITRRAGVTTRLLMTMIAAALAWGLLDARLVRLDIGLVDHWLTLFPFASLLLTLVAVGGVAHAINIIDGFNGLSSFYAVLAFAALGLVAWQVGDVFLLKVCLVSIASIAGFLVWNFPFGRVFLGDSGAYLIGFLLAEVSVLLVMRHPTVSAWFPMLVMIYPVWETVFSILRRMNRGLGKVGEPDALHLHQLVHRRFVRNLVRQCPHQRLGHRQRTLLNSTTSVYLWGLSLMAIVPAVIFYDQTAILLFCTVLFAATYVLIYRKIINFGIPIFIRRIIFRRFTMGTFDNQKNLPLTKTDINF